MGGTPSERLVVEAKLYEKHKSEWLRKYRDQYVVLKGENLLGFFADFHNAYCAGVQEYGIEADFLVKRVVSQEPVFVVF